MPPAQTNRRVTILLLGETGVGKSTFINGFINYLRFDHFPETKEEFSRIIWAIGMRYDHVDENCNAVTVSVGRFDDNENANSSGASMTQDPKVHVFNANGTEIHLIDTPGIGDTRGYDYDKANCAKIIDFIRDYEIHGICMLMKPNNARLNTFFKFCVYGILVHLPANAVENIVFCFTNVRATLYRPVDTLPVLESLLEQENIRVPLTPDRIYCFDNEAIRFLAARVNGIEFPPDKVTSFRESWDRAAAEMSRLVLFVAQCAPHRLHSAAPLYSVWRP